LYVIIDFKEQQQKTETVKRRRLVFNKSIRGRKEGEEERGGFSVFI
jgi:hypothetical protein